MTQRAAYLADLMLVDRCIEGESAAASELFRRYQRRVQATLYRVLGSNRDMDDLLQETFLQVFASLGGYRGEARLSTWIDRIAARVAYRYLSRKRTAVPVVDMPVEPGHELAGPAADPRDQAAAREGVRRLYAALAALSPAARVAFALHEIDGKTVAEVADCVGASVTATKLRIWRARRAIMKRAQEDPVLAELLRDVVFGAEEMP